MIAPADRNSLLLSTQRALLGNVGGSLWGVSADLQDGVIVITFYVRPEISEDEREDLRAAATEVIADYPDGYLVDDRFVELIDPKKIPGDGPWAFLRREALRD